MSGLQGPFYMSTEFLPPKLVSYSSLGPFGAVCLFVYFCAWYFSECITRWFDFDDPNGNGDYEYLSNLLNAYPGLICPNPIGIEVQTVSGQPAFQTGNIFQV